MLLLRGTRDREAKKYWGVGAGRPHSHTKPRVGHRKEQKSGLKGVHC